MGVLKKNEAKNEDMADICKYLHQYVPGHREDSTESTVKTLSGGDYFTFERHKQAQMSVRDDSTPSLRLEGLVPKLEEFHNQAELMKVLKTVEYTLHGLRFMPVFLFFLFGLYIPVNIFFSHVQRFPELNQC